MIEKKIVRPWLVPFFVFCNTVGIAVMVFALIHRPHHLLTWICIALAIFIGPQVLFVIFLFSQRNKRDQLDDQIVTDNLIASNQQPSNSMSKAGGIAIFLTGMSLVWINYISFERKVFSMRSRYGHQDVTVHGTEARVLSLILVLLGIFTALMGAKNFWQKKNDNLAISDVLGIFGLMLVLGMFILSGYL